MFSFKLKIFVTFLQKSSLHLHMLLYIRLEVLSYIYMGFPLIFTCKRCDFWKIMLEVWWFLVLLYIIIDFESGQEAESKLDIDRSWLAGECINCMVELVVWLKWSFDVIDQYVTWDSWLSECYCNALDLFWLGEYVLYRTCFNWTKVLCTVCKWIDVHVHDLKVTAKDFKLQRLANQIESARVWPRRLTNHR